jgi:hypothetical protein
MNIETKIKKLRILPSLQEVKLGDFSRLVDGDLSDLGDALASGKQVLLAYTGKVARFFSASRDEYEIVSSRITVGDVSFPEPETVAPAVGQPYWVLSLTKEKLTAMLEWSDGDFDRRALKSAQVHLTEEAAIEHAKALIKLSGGVYVD